MQTLQFPEFRPRALQGDVRLYGVECVRHSLLDGEDAGYRAAAQQLLHGGHQFGVWNRQSGDGAAELRQQFADQCDQPADHQGRRGRGQTPYAPADGDVLQVFVPAAVDYRDSGGAAHGYHSRNMAQGGTGVHFDVLLMDTAVSAH
ncbi:MAG: YdiU family protein [Bacteroidales bacterium]|nr:YdiU family protein [Bacteroidales bacterium]